MQNLKRTIAVLGCVMLAAAASAQSRKLRVFVYTSVDASGFIEDEQRGREDSVRDLQKKLKGRDLELAKSAAEADLWLEVLSRTNSRANEILTEGSVDKQGRIQTTSGRYSGKRVDTKLHVCGDGYETRLVGWSSVSYLTAADDVAGQLDRWLKNNQKRLQGAK